MPNNRTPIPVSDMPALTEAFYDEDEGAYVVPVVHQRQPAAPSLFEQHIALLCDADIRSVEPDIRRIADIDRVYALANAYASQRVTL